MSKDRGRNLKEYFILSCILENKLSIFKHNKIKKEFHNHIEGNNIIIIGKDEFYCNWVCLYIYIYIYKAADISIKRKIRGYTMGEQWWRAIHPSLRNV